MLRMVIVIQDYIFPSIFVDRADNNFTGGCWRFGDVDTDFLLIMC